MIIVIPSAFGKHLQRCLEHLNAAELPEDVTIMVVNKKPFNFSNVCNLGFDLGEDVLLMNDDVFVRPDTIKKMLEARDEGIVGAVLLYPNGEVQHGGATFSDYGWRHIGSVPNKDKVVDGVTFALVLIPWPVIERVGYMDNKFDPTYFEDVDYCLRAREEGIKCVLKHDAVATHLESVTTRPKGMSSSASFGYFKEKWGGKIVQN